nr:hypothetical protein Iba_chr02aCG19850 [Ipomoea batatas]
MGAGELVLSSKSYCARARAQQLNLVPWPCPFTRFCPWEQEPMEKKLIKYLISSNQLTISDGLVGMPSFAPLWDDLACAILLLSEEREIQKSDMVNFSFEDEG